MIKRNYLLIGYNSGGYKSSEKIEFNGKIEKLYKSDPDHPDTQRTVSYFRITHSDGSVINNDHQFIDELILKTRGYREDFLLTQVLEINEISLHVVIKNNDINTAIKLVKAGVNVDALNQDGQTALHIVAINSDYFGVSQLLEAGANINAKNKKGKTALESHIKYTNDKDFIEFLNDRLSKIDFS